MFGHFSKSYMKGLTVTWCNKMHLKKKLSEQLKEVHYTKKSIRIYTSTFIDCKQYLAVSLWRRVRMEDIPRIDSTLIASS